MAEEMIQSKAANSTPERGGSERAHKLGPFVVALLCAFSTPALFGQQNIHAGLIPSANRKPAPAFQLFNELGSNVRLSDYRGKVILLDFWATDCGGCVLEIPSYIALEKAYKDKGFAALGISVDIAYEQLKDANEAWGRVRPFMAKHGVNYTIAMGDEAVSKAYALNIYPATYLIDKSGRIAVSYVGVLIDKNNVEANIKKLLSEP